MPNEASSYDLEDPLQGYSYLSLFPRNCRTLGVVANPTELSDLESVHNVLKTVGLKDTSRCIEQARMIVESSSEDMRSEVNDNVAVQKESDAVRVVDDEVARKRRPGLGRMQAKFNINRRVSQPDVIKVPQLDITKLKDPEEFFMAHERLEHAKKELRKQSGIFPDMDVDITDTSLTARPRRPGIPGRSKVTYKHHPPSVVSNDDVLKESFAGKTDKGLNSSLSPPPESFLLSQDKSRENHRSPFNEKTLPEVNVPSKDGVLGGSISEINGFLDEILSGTYGHLNSEGQLTLLQEQLQLKPINIENLSLPKFPEIPKYDFKISGNPSKPRKSLHDIQATFSGINIITTEKSTLTPGSVGFSASPTPPKSPFSNLSSLKKHILQLNRSKDSFSEFNTDPCAAGVSSPVSGADKQPDSVYVQEDSGSKCKVLSDDDDISALSNKSLHQLLEESGDLPNPVDYIPTLAAKASSIPANKSGSAMGDENGVPDDPQNMTEYCNGSPSNERSDVVMQSGTAAVDLTPPEPFPFVVDQHSSPTAGSHGKLRSTNPNQCSARHEVEGEVNRSTNKKTRRKTVPVHRTTILRHRRRGTSADDTDAQEQVSSRNEVQVENLSTRTDSMQPESSIDNSRSLGVEIHENQSKLPDTASEIEIQKVHETSLNLKRKGKSSPIQEHDVRVDARKKQKRKSCVSRIRNDIVIPTKESGDHSGSTSAELDDNQSEIPNSHPVQQEELFAGNVLNALVDKNGQANNVSSREQVEHAEENINPRKKAKRKELSLRKSIAGAGTFFKAGVRKSNRQKSRPLEFWRGERYLYARLEPDSTLPTLIGVKRYATPAKKEDKPVFKVEDKVDGKKYRELIDLAALH